MAKIFLSNITDHKLIKVFCENKHKYNASIIEILTNNDIYSIFIRVLISLISL